MIDAFRTILFARFGGAGPWLFLAIGAGLVLMLSLRWYASHKNAMGQSRASDITAYMGAFGLLIVLAGFFWLTA